MAESILVTGKKISSMELVTNVTGNEKIPTGQPDDLAITTNQIADHTITRGDLASQEDLSQVEVDLTTQIATLAGDVATADNSIRGLIAAEEAARIAADNLKVDKEGSVSSVAGRVGDVELTPSDVLVEGFGSQEDVNRYIPKPFLSGYAYSLGERVVLASGEVVKSTVEDNVSNPNDGMVGWVSEVSDSLATTVQTFTTPEAGVDPVTGVAEGAYFNVRSTEDHTVTIEYQNIGGTPTSTGKSFPSSAALNDVKEEVQKAKLYFATIADLTSYNARYDNQVVTVRSYDSSLDQKGGGNFQFKQNDLTTPDGVYSFAGNGGVWYRLNWKSPDIYDAGIRADGTDETVKFKALLKSASSYFGSTSISLRGKTVKITDFEIPSNITIYNGVLDFSESTTILADNKYFNGFIVGANRNGDRTTNPNTATNYVNLPQLKNVGFIKIGFKAPPSGTYSFSTDFIYLTKVDGFVFKHCYGTDTNSNRIFTIVGGSDSTVTTNDIDTFDTIDPINGWSSNIQVKYNKFNAGKNFGLNANGQYLIVPSFRLTGCEDIEVAYNNFKNFNFGSLIDKHCRNGSQHDNTCSIDDDVLDLWLSKTSRTAQCGMYVGQSAYNIDTKNNKLRNFIQLGITYEGASFGECSGNIATMSNHAKTLALDLTLSRGIDLQPNIREHPFTAVAGVQGLHIHNNTIKGYKTPLTTSGVYDWSLKDLHIHDNHLEGQNGNIAMTLSRCFDVRAHDNKLVGGGLGLGQIKDSVINANKVSSPSNYALYLTSAEKSGLSIFDNDFVVDSGSAIYNGTAAGGLIEIQGGKIQSKNDSAAFYNTTGAGAVRAYNFSNGVTEMRQVLTPRINLAAGARTVISQAVTGVKLGWLADVSVGSVGTLWTNSSIDLTVKAGVRTGTVDILVRNEGASAVNLDFVFLLELKSFMSNTYNN